MELTFNLLLVFRALGIPSRPVTNFVSARDTNHTLSIDKYFDVFGDEMKGGPDGDNQDAMWNFHAWYIIRNISIDFGIIINSNDLILKDWSLDVSPRSSTRLQRVASNWPNSSTPTLEEQLWW